MKTINVCAFIFESLAWARITVMVKMELQFLFYFQNDLFTFNDFNIFS
jgi:hypothetical protein